MQILGISHMSWNGIIRLGLSFNEIYLFDERYGIRDYFFNFHQLYNYKHLFQLLVA